MNATSIFAIICACLLLMIAISRAEQKTDADQAGVLPKTLASLYADNDGLLADNSDEHEMEKRRFNAWAGKRSQLSKRRFNAWAGR